jgi:hypothetical protein
LSDADPERQAEQKRDGVRATQRIPHDAVKEVCGTQLKAFSAVQYSQFAGARPLDFAASFAGGSSGSPGRLTRRTMRPPQCSFLLRSSYNEKNN